MVVLGEPESGKDCLGGSVHQTSHEGDFEVSLWLFGKKSLWGVFLDIGMRVDELSLRLL
jgi:hypothetical protein